MKHYLLLCDYGLDDAAATVLLLNQRSPEDRVDLVPVGGNMPLSQTRKNARILLSHFKGSLEGVRLVDTASVPQPEEQLPSIHGKDGMGDFLTEQPLSSVSMLSYEEWERSLSGEEILVSLGPLTLPKLLLETHRFSRFYLMAGNISHEPNFRGREFNHALDVPAFAACVRYPHLCATLDTCRHPAFNFVKNPPESTDPLLSALYQRSLHYATARHADRCFVYDWVLVYAMLHPEQFTSRDRVDPDGNLVTVLEYLG